MVVGLSMQSIWNINIPPKFPKFNFKKCSKLIAKNIARTQISCILYERSKPLDYWDLSNIPLKNQTKSKFITVFYNTFTFILQWTKQRWIKPRLLIIGYFLQGKGPNCSLPILISFYMLFSRQK